MRHSRIELANRALFALIAIPALWQLVLLATAVFSRLAYPFDLEWMEGGLLDHAARLQEGSGIYAEPSVEFIPYLYTPLYPALLAILGEVFGLSYVLGRTLSLIALLTCFAVVILSTQTPGERFRLREGLLGVLGLGVIAAAYPWLEGWYDIVRGDTVFLAMVLSGLYLLWRWLPTSGARSHRRIAAVAALLSLSFFCKQIGVLFVFAGGVNLVLFGRWRLIPTYVATSAVIGLGGTLLLNTVSDGWFWTYIYEVHQSHDFNIDRFKLSFSHMLKRSIAAGVIISVSMLAIGGRLLARRALPVESKRFLFWVVPYIIAVVAGAVGWATQWAHFNAYMSAIFVGAVAVATGLVSLAALARSWFPRAGWWLALALPAVLATELFTQRWKPAKFIPHHADVVAGDRLIELLANIEGDVMVPFHPWYARLAGKETWVHRMGLMDIRLARKHRVRHLPNVYRDKRFAAIVLDNRPLTFALADLKASYRRDSLVPKDHRPRVFTGAKVTPASIWIPIEPPQPPQGARVLFEFEEPLVNWQRSGEEWGTLRYSHPRAKPALGVSGMHIGTSAVRSDRASGEATSPPFTISGGRITARIGGPKSSELRVELRIDGQTVRSASPDGSLGLRAIEWKLGELRGKRATLVLIDHDESPKKNLSVDAIWMWER